MIRFVLRHGLIGFVAACLFVALLLGLDVVGLRGLLAASPDAPLLVAVLVMLLGGVFAAAQVSVALIPMAGRDDPGRDARPRPPRGLLDVPVVPRRR